MQLPVSDVLIRHRNSEATADLIIPVHIICNTPDDVLIRNIKANSRLDKKWQAVVPEHERIAVICGSGPSMADTLDEVREWHEAGATIFALNGCAKFLADNGITAHYQVMCDARPENVDLIGPAWNHLFASQCDPELFERVPDAILWHLQIGDIEDYFPDYQGPYALIGGAASVGNTTTCLAYAMGYRTLHLYGFDSCHKEGKGHAFSQPLNDGDPVLVTEWAGKQYLTSFTMKHQAEKFLETSAALREMGTKIHVHGYGLLPDMVNTPKMEEVDKYRAMWAFEGYRNVSPGEEVAKTFVEIVDPVGTVGDFGCGTGRGGLAISKLTDCDVTLVDFAENSRDRDAQHLDFVLADLTKPINLMVDYGYCCDVMEHIPTEDVPTVIKNVMESCRIGCFFQISTVDDRMGVLIGQVLHLTVKPLSWWSELFSELGFRVTFEQENEDSCNLNVTKEQ
ncbi:MAG TPA: 6-hydroxymethylpterin diphosphokinase MptE-like protein [Gallionellaceae bacterium]